MTIDAELRDAREAVERSAWQALANCCFGTGDPRWDRMGFSFFISFIVSVLVFFLTDYKNQSASIGAVSLFLFFISLCAYCGQAPNQVEPLQQPLALAVEAADSGEVEVRVDVVGAAAAA